MARTILLLWPLRMHRNFPLRAGPDTRLREFWRQGRQRRLGRASRDYVNAGGNEVAAVEIAARAERGDPQAKASLDRYVGRLARALASVINVLDPDAIVLGGGMSNVEMLYSAVPAQWSRFVFSDRVDTRLLRAAHGDSSGVRGAAWL